MGYEYSDIVACADVCPEPVVGIVVDSTSYGSTSSEWLLDDECGDGYDSDFDGIISETSAASYDSDEEIVSNVSEEAYDSDIEESVNEVSVMAYDSDFDDVVSEISVLPYDSGFELEDELSSEEFF